MKIRLVRPSVAIAALLGLAVTVASLTSCVTSRSGPKPVTLKDAFKKYFRVGVAVNRLQATGSVLPADNGEKTAEQITNDVALIKAQFNQISPENDLKWEVIQPYEGPKGYNFAPSDAYVNFGISNHMYIVGHTLVWHSQVPGWVFAATNAPPPDGWIPSVSTPSRPPGGRGGGFGRGGGGGGARATREQVLQRLHDHIATVVGRYKGKIKVWDVVNEALDDSGSTNILRNSPWLQIVGPDFIAKAFEYAHEADPNAILRYNDYSLENPTKRRKLITLIKSLQAQHVPVMAIGSQTHVSVSSPSFQTEDSALTEIASLGLQIHITELDVNGSAGGQRNTGADVAANAAATQGGLVDSANQKLADEYTILFNAFVKHSDSVKVVTFWGANDAISWRANGRPLLFDGNDQPKAAFDAVIATANPAQKK